MLSAQPAVQSGHLSRGVTEFIVGSDASIDDDFIDRLDHRVRKNAHLFTYLILGVLMMNALRRSGISGYRVIVLSFVICALYAGSDEVHQLFVQGRGAEVKDVVIDSVGALLGIGLYSLMAKVGKR